MHLASFLHAVLGRSLNPRKIIPASLPSAEVRHLLPEMQQSGPLRPVVADWKPAHLQRRAVYGSRYFEVM